MKTATSLLLFSVLGLLALGIVILGSAGMNHVRPLFMVKQLIWTGVGLLACLAAASVNYRWLRSCWWVFLLVAIGLLVCVWVPGLGVRIKGSSRWLGAGGFMLQPSEFAKVAILIALAWYGERYQRFMPQFVRGLVVPGLGLAAVLGLILLEPDVGTTVLLGGVSCLLLLIAGTRWIYVLPPVCLAVAGLVIFLIHNPNRSERLHAWLHPYETRMGKGRQAYNSMAAFGSGGLNGVGLGEGRTKLGFIPENHTDFILSIIGEELGLAATLAVIVAYLTILVTGVYIAWHAADAFGMLLACGLTLLIALQAVINIGVVTGTFPNKGIALPFLSYGGSNLVVMLGSVGILLSIGRLACAPASARPPVGEADALTASGAA